MHTALCKNNCATFLVYYGIMHEELTTESREIASSDHARIDVTSGDADDYGSNGPLPTAQAALDDVSSLRAVSNPTRMRILGLLRTRGAMTVGEIGSSVGIASGSVSYHMRQLERAGLAAVDDADDHDGRRRWWRACHVAMSPVRLGEAQDAASVVDYKRAVSQTYRDVYARFLDNMETVELPWADAATNLDAAVELTLDEFAAMNAELESLLHRWRQIGAGHAGHRDDTRSIAVIMQAFPWLA